MKKKKKYQKPEVVKIPVDIRQMVRNWTPGCPYVFVWDGRKYLKENNILPDSEDLNRQEKVVKDYYVIQNQPQEEEGFLRFKLSEFEREVSWLDGFELLTVEHPQGYKIGITRRGELLNYQKPRLPLQCFDNKGRDCLKLISNQNWYNPVSFFSAKPGDYLYLDFGRVKANSLKFILVDPPDSCPTYGPPCPTLCGKFLRKCDDVSIHVYLNEFIEEIDVFHTRTEFYPDIVDLTPYLPQIKGNLKIKLEFTAHHKVSFGGIDTTPPIPMKKRAYNLAQAIHSELGDVRDILNKENDQFVRLIPGEEIELKFPAPEPARPGNKLSYVLVSRGYYIPVTELMSLNKEAVLA